MSGLFRHPPAPQAPPPPDAAWMAGVPTAEVISPAGIAVSVSFGTPLVIGPEQTLLPSGIAVSVSFGTPGVVGPPQTIIDPIGIAVGVTFGAPALVGGRDWSLYIGGVDRTAYLKPGAVTQPKLGGGGGGGGTGAAGGGVLTITSSQLGRAIASFDLFASDGWAPRATQTVVLTERGITLFVGCLKAVTSEPIQPGFARNIFHCLAGDKSSLCDNRVVIKTYATGYDVNAMILDIVSNFLTGEGITTGGVIVTSTLDTDMIFNYQSVTNAFDQIAAYTGAQWWIDFNGVLNFAVITDWPVAPFSVTATSDNVRNLQSSETTSGYANKFYAVSNLVVLPGSGTTGASRVETYTLGPNGQAAAFAAGLPFGYCLTELPIQSLVGVKVNGVAQPVFSVITQPYDTAGWYYFGGVTTAAVVFPFNTPSVADVIEISYVPIFQNASVNTAPAITGTCGSGIWEGVIQVKNIQFQDQLDSIAAAYQARSGTIPFIVTYETDTPGLAVGQQQSIDLPSLPGLTSTTIYLTQVSQKIDQANAGGVNLGHGTALRYSIEGTTQQNLGNWLNYYERLISATKFPLPLARYEVASFVLGGGASIAGGLQPANPYQVSNSGQLLSASVGAFTPPTGQDLLVDFLVDGVSVFGTNPKPTIPGGGTANTFYTVTLFSTPGLFVQAGQVITCSVSYRTSSLTTTAAAAGTANLKWSY